MKNQHVRSPRMVQPFAFNPDILDALVDVVCILDPKGVFRYVSASSVHLFGYSPEEMTGAAFVRFIHPDDVQKTTCVTTNYTSAQTSHFENRYVRKDGRIIPVIWSGRWNPEDGLLYCVARDGSEKSCFENRLVKAQQIARVANFEFDLETRTYLYVSDTLYDIFGLDRTEYPVFTTELYWSLIHPDDMQRVQDNILQPPPIYSPALEYRIVRPDGRMVHILRVRELIRDVNGKALRSFGTIQDITDRKISELALRQSEERFRSLVQNGNDLIGIIDPTGTYLFVGANVREHLDYHPYELLGKNAVDLIHPEDQSWVAAVLEDVTVNKTITTAPFRFLDGKGIWRWMEATLSNQLNNPAIRGLVVNSRDVTQRKQQEEELHRLSLVAKETENAVAITNPDRTTLWVNAAFTRMTGYTPEEVIGKKQSSLLEGPLTNLETVAHITEAYEKQLPFQAEILNYKKDGEPFWSELHVQPIFDAQGRITQFFSLRKDTTQRKQFEKELEEERLRTTTAAIAAQERERAAVSQELHDNVNQVLTTIKLYTEMVRDGIGNTRELMGKSAMLLQDSINEIRSLSKQLSAPSLGQIRLAESIQELVCSINHTRRVVISVDTTEISGQEFSQDTHLGIYRILQEHLTNILKHAQAQQVTIRFRHQGNRVLIVVTDNGIGFDPRKKREGIGLANMCMRAKSLKGTIKIISAPGQGCELRINIPVEPAGRLVSL